MSQVTSEIRQGKDTLKSAMQDFNIAFISKSFTTMDIIPIAIHIPRRKIEPSIKLGIICIEIERCFWSVLGRKYERD